MNIVIYSSTFLPSIGGLENIMAGLASHWRLKGHKVVVYTRTKDSRKAFDTCKYRVIRTENMWSMFIAAQKADVFVEANISLKTCLIGLLIFRKWVVIHHLPYNHRISIASVIKNMLTLVSRNIAVSKYVSTTLYGKSRVIHNFYNPIFCNLGLPRPQCSLLFVGRLVSDKGVMLLLNAVLELSTICSTLQLSIVGDGEEKIRLIEFVRKHDLQERVTFLGSQSPEVLNQLYNQHQIVVIPSIWKEPFGVVALEALACGALVVYANGGGLSEAVDKNCISFESGSIQSLKDGLYRAIIQVDKVSGNMGYIAEHLRKFSIDQIASNYLAYFKKFENGFE